MRVSLPASVLVLLLLSACTTQKPAPTAPRPHTPPKATVPGTSTIPPVEVTPPRPIAPVPGAAMPTPAPAAPQPPRHLADGSRVPAVQALLASAQEQVKAGKLDAAGSSLERAQRLAPQSAQVYQRLAEVRLRQQRPAEAEQLLRKALGFASSTSQQAAIWRQLAVARQRQGRNAEAQDALGRAAALEPSPH